MLTQPVFKQADFVLVVHDMQDHRDTGIALRASTHGARWARKICSLYMTNRNQSNRVSLLMDW